MSDKDDKGFDASVDGADIAVPNDPRPASEEYAVDAAGNVSSVPIGRSLEVSQGARQNAEEPVDPVQDAEGDSLNDE